MVPWLSENFPAQFLNDLLEQTLELRRDPKEREEEIEQEEARRWLEENRNATLVFKGDDGEEEIIDVADFAWAD